MNLLLHAWLAQQTAPAPQGSSPWSLLQLAVPILLIFYFLLWRPQQKEQKEHQSLLSALQKGDRVVTASGLHGRVWEVGDAVVTLEVADKVRIDVDKDTIKRKAAQKTAEKAAPAEAAKGA